MDVEGIEIWGEKDEYVDHEPAEENFSMPRVMPVTMEALIIHFEV